jgi:phage repressor protein C with HTH and peptisase S24 domain
MHPTMQRLYLAATELQGRETQSAVARLLNESPQTLNNWEARGMSKKGILNAEEIIGCRAAWLSTGKGEMTAAAAQEHLADQRISAHMVLVPVLANHASMGAGSDYIEGDLVIGSISVSMDWVKSHLPHVRRPTDLRFIHGRGSSMSPTYDDGDILLVDTGHRTPDIDTVYVLSCEGNLFIKRVSRMFDGRHQITSDNPSDKLVQMLEGGQEVSVLGRVVWAWNGKRL